MRKLNFGCQIFDDNDYLFLFDLDYELHGTFSADSFALAASIALSGALPRTMAKSMQDMFIIYMS